LQTDSKIDLFNSFKKFFKKWKLADEDYSKALALCLLIGSVESLEFVFWNANKDFVLITLEYSHFREFIYIIKDDID